MVWNECGGARQGGMVDRVDEAAAGCCALCKRTVGDAGQRKICASRRSVSWMYALYGTTASVPTELIFSLQVAIYASPKNYRLWCIAIH